MRTVCGVWPGAAMPAGRYPYLAPSGRRETGEVSGRPAERDLDRRVRQLERLGARVIVLPAAEEPLALAGLIEGFDARRR